MPIRTYESETFVAYLDISGFKKLMQKHNRAWRALDVFYQAGYEVIRQRSYQSKVDGLFISDSGVLFVRKGEREVTRSPIALKLLLNVAAEINKRVTSKGFILTTSIAYGRFQYQNRIEFPGIGKVPVYGHAYLSAFLDSESGTPKIQPGQCRILVENLPDQVKDALSRNESDAVFKMMRLRPGDNKHYYFYWMVDHPGRIKEFEEKYRDAYNLKYGGILEALRSTGSGVSK